jgi:hypothetical protein
MAVIETLPLDAIDPAATAALPPMEKIRGKNYPGPEATDERKHEYIKSLLSETEADALAMYKQAAHHVLFANGRQHIGWKSTKRQWEDLPLSEGDIRVTMNYVIVILRARVQRLVSSEINWRGVPRDNSLKERDRTKVAVNLVKSRYLAQKMEQKVRAGVMQSAMTGVVALKSFWNPNIGPLTPAKMFFPEPVMQPGIDPMTGQETQMPALDPVTGEPQMQQVEKFVDADGNPVETVEQAFHFRPGDTDTSVRTVFNLRFNPEALGWTDAEGMRWLIDTDIVPLTVAKERFPKIADKIKPLDGPESSITYERMVRGSAVKQPSQLYTTSPASGSARQTDPAQLTAIREYWELRSPFFPKGRLIVVVGGAVAYDGPWPHGVFPYSPIFGEPGVMSAKGRSPVGDMISPQEAINREWTAIVKQSMSQGAAQWVAWAIPGVPDAIPRDDYAVMQIPVRSALFNRPIGDIIKRIDPASVSGDRWRIIEQAKATIFDIGAYHEVSRGQIPPGLDSGVAIQHLLESESAQLKDAVDALKDALIQWARHQLAIAKWGYGDAEGRWIPVDRPDLGFMIHSLEGMELPDPETIGLDIEYFRPHSESATRGEVKDLLGMGVIDPRKALKIMDLGAGFEEAFESQTRHYARARKENLDFETGNYIEVPEPVTDPMTGAVIGEQLVCMHMDPETGQPYPFFLPEDDDHAIHIDVHAEILLDETQPWTLRAKVMQHIAQHRQKLQEVMAAQMPQPSAPPGDGAQ